MIPTSRQVTVNYTGTTEMATKFYLFIEDHGAIREMWVDVPQFTGSTQVLFTLPGELHHITVTPSSPTLVAGATQQFTAVGYDAATIRSRTCRSPGAWRMAEARSTAAVSLPPEPRQAPTAIPWSPRLARLAALLR